MRSPFILAFLVCSACSKSVAEPAAFDAAVARAPEPAALDAAVAKAPEPAAVDAAVPVVDQGGGRGEGIGLGSISPLLRLQPKVLEGDATPESIERVLRHDPELAKCYREGRERGVVGTATFDVKISPSGKGASVGTMATTFERDVTRCLSNAIGDASFPRTPGLHFACDVAFVAGQRAPKQ